MSQPHYQPSRLDEILAASSPETPQAEFRPAAGATSTSEPAHAGQLLELQIDAIQPNDFQPRNQFDESELTELSASISELGVLQPILVRPKPNPDTTSQNRYELIAGERRWRAARRAGLETIPAIVRDVTDLASLQQAIVENLHRSELNSIEEAASYSQLANDFGLSQDEIAKSVGKSRPAVANIIRLLQLPASVQQMLVQGEISEGHARALLRTPSAHRQADLAKLVVAKELSVRDTESLVRTPNRSRSNTSESKPQTKTDLRPSWSEDVENQLEDYLDTRVTVTTTKADGPESTTRQSNGKITFEFADETDLTRMLDLIIGKDR